MDRRQFITLAAGASLGTAAGGPLWGNSGGQVIDAGPVGGYAADGAYDAYSDLGFFVIRSGKSLTAISSICTHRHVTLTSKPGCTFYCKRHGSIFDCEGHPTKGPATKDLPKLTTSISSAGHLLVTVLPF